MLITNPCRSAFSCSCLLAITAITGLTLLNEQTAKAGETEKHTAPRARTTGLRTRSFGSEATKQQARASADQLPAHPRGLPRYPVQPSPGDAVTPRHRYTIIEGPKEMPQPLVAQSGSSHASEVAHAPGAGGKPNEQSRLEKMSRGANLRRDTLEKLPKQEPGDLIGRPQRVIRHEILLSADPRYDGKKIRLAPPGIPGGRITQHLDGEGAGDQRDLLDEFADDPLGFVWDAWTESLPYDIEEYVFEDYLNPAIESVFSVEPLPPLTPPTRTPTPPSVGPTPPNPLPPLPPIDKIINKPKPLDPHNGTRIEPSAIWIGDHPNVVMNAPGIMVAGDSASGNESFPLTPNGPGSIEGGSTNRRKGVPQFGYQPGNRPDHELHASQGGNQKQNSQETAVTPPEPPGHTESGITISGPDASTSVKKQSNAKEPTKKDNSADKKSDPPKKDPMESQKKDPEEEGLPADDGSGRGGNDVGGRRIKRGARDNRSGLQKLREPEVWALGKKSGPADEEEPDVGHGSGAANPPSDPLSHRGNDLRGQIGNGSGGAQVPGPTEGVWWYLHGTRAQPTKR